MNSFSLVPFLFAAQIVFWMMVARRAGASWRIVLFPVSVFGIWAAVVARLSTDGTFDSPQFLDLYPGLWLPAVPFALATLVLVVSKSLRTTCYKILSSVPAHWFVGLQALRVTAIGTFVLMMQGRFPEHVELAIGLTDLAFGVSAVFLFFPVKKNKLSKDFLALWHVVGVLIILIPGELAIQRGLPGPMQTFSGEHSSEVMLDLWLVWGPSLVVPLFLIFNILAATSSVHRLKRTEQAKGIRSFGNEKFEASPPAQKILESV